MAGNNENKKEKEEHICIECAYLGFGMKRNGDEEFYCMYENGRGTKDEYGKACKSFLPENANEADND